ncbi:MAG: beta-propeller fold lactonase family protein, partial [Pirellulaceae bacterium]
QSGRLTSLGQTATEANPRSFTIHANGRFLYAAGQDTNRLAIFRRDQQGRLKRLETVSTGKRPWWLTLVTTSDAR